MGDQQKTKYAQNEEEKQYDDGHLDDKRGFDNRLDKSIKSYIANVDGNNSMKLTKMTQDLLQTFDERRDNDNKLWMLQNNEKYADLSRKIDDLQLVMGNVAKSIPSNEVDEDEDAKEEEYGLGFQSIASFASNDERLDEIGSLIVSVDKSIQSIKPSTLKTTACTFMAQIVALFSVVIAYWGFLGIQTKR